MATYGIIGGGTCPKNIIEDGLRDLGIDGNDFIIVGHKKPSPNEERVYDFLIENEASFEVVYDQDGTPPRILADNAQQMHKTDNTTKRVLERIMQKDGVLLILWDDDNTDEMNNVIYQAFDNKIVTKELSNGLIPIDVKDETPTFTEEEFESMPPAVQKRNSTSNPSSTVENLTITTPSSQRPQIVAPDGDCMITVVMPNGTVISTPATVEEVRVLLGLSGGS